MIRTIKVSKLTDDFYPQFFLALDEFAVKEVNQNITFSRVQRVLPQLNDRTAESRRSHLFQTFSDWFSHDSLNNTQRGNEKGGSGGAILLSRIFAADSDPKFLLRSQVRGPPASK